MFSPPSHRDYFRVLLVAFLTLFAGLFTYGLFSASSWNSTLHYGGDSLEILARLKLSAETGLDTWLGRPVERLGAPFSITWSNYPQSDQWLFWLGGKLSLWIGLIPTTHALMLTAHVLGALSFFICARLLGHRPLWAGCCAVLFGLSHFSIFRGLTHFSFALSFLLPPMLLAAWWIGSGRQLKLGKTTLALSLGLALFVGAANPYYVFIFLQLLAGSLLFQLLTARRQLNLFAGVALAACTALSAVVWNAPTLWARLHAGAGEPLVRSYAGNELYALKFVELFVPPPSHHFPVFADFGRYYGGSTSLRGEIFSPYLGLIPAVGLLLIVLAGIHRLVLARGGLKPSHGPWALWFLLMGSVGGIQAWIALAGINYFRATNRYSIVIVALSLFFLARYFSRARWLKNRPALNAVLAVTITCLGLWDQIPPAPPAASQQAASEKIRRDTAFAAFLENALPARARIFQLPAVAFPEQPPVVGMTDYAHFRPFLFSHSLRFSYGSLVGTPEANWARWVGTLPASELVSTLQAAGFDAVTINRTGYKDRANALLSTLAEAGFPTLTDPYANSEHAVIRLHPAASPQSPDLADPRLLRPWHRGKPTAPGQPELYATSGWFGFEQQDDTAWRWAGRDAVLTLRNPGPTSRKARVEFEFASNKPGRLALHHNGRPLWNSPATIALAGSGEIVLELPLGTTDLDWSYKGPITRPSTGDNRELGFKIQNLRVTFVD